MRLIESRRCGRRKGLHPVLAALTCVAPLVSGLDIEASGEEDASPPPRANDGGEDLPSSVIREFSSRWQENATRQCPWVYTPERINNAHDITNPEIYCYPGSTENTVETTLPMPEEKMQRLRRYFTETDIWRDSYVPFDHWKMDVIRDLFNSFSIDDGTKRVDIIGILNTGLPHILSMSQGDWRRGESLRLFVCDVRRNQFSEIRVEEADPFGYTLPSARIHHARRYEQEDYELPGLEDFCNGDEHVRSYQRGPLFRMPRVAWKLFSPEKIGIKLSPLEPTGSREKPMSSVVCIEEPISIGTDETSPEELLRRLKEEAHDPEATADLIVPDLFNRHPAGAVVMNYAIETALTGKTTHIIHRDEDEMVWQIEFYHKQDPKPADELIVFDELLLGRGYEQRAAILPNAQKRKTLRIKPAPDAPSDHFDSTQIEDLKRTTVGSWLERNEEHRRLLSNRVLRIRTDRASSEATGA